MKTPTFYPLNTENTTKRSVALSDFEKERTRLESEGHVALLLFLFLLFCFILPPFAEKQIEKTGCANLVSGAKARLTSCRQHPQRQISSSDRFSQFVFGPINIHTASKERLMTVRGIGEAMAEQLLQMRRKGQLTHPEILLQIKGVGKKRSRYLAEKISFEKVKKAL